MLIIGHRGAAGLAPENTLESLHIGLEAGADILEFDIRLTKDGIPVLSHDAKIHGVRVKKTSLHELRKHGSVTTLKEVLDTFYGKTLLNIELKPMRDVSIVYDLIRSYVKADADWDNVLISSFHVRYLLALRRFSSKIPLALLHSVNPFAFTVYQRKLQLSAVGWHRLHVNTLAIEIAKRSEIFTYVYTVNRQETALRLTQRGIDGIVTDYPDKIS